MIHYHGTPLGGKKINHVDFFRGRHALVSFAYPEDIGIVADLCQSFVLDNGAFTVWKRGGELDVGGYIKWVEQWHRHPGFDWALIPDVIEGSELENDEMITNWPDNLRGVPVWHMHESVERLRYLSRHFQVTALGSSGEWPTPGTQKWWARMNDAMAAICDDRGRPPCRLHGLRMLNPAVFQKLPLSSADSTNAAVNSGSLGRYGMYMPPTAAQRAGVIASMIEQHNSAPVWKKTGHEQLELILN
jgi:hypothetical protein